MIFAILSIRRMLLIFVIVIFTNGFVVMVLFFLFLFIYAEKLTILLLLQIVLLILTYFVGMRDWIWSNAAVLVVIESGKLLGFKRVRVVLLTIFQRRCKLICAERLLLVLSLKCIGLILKVFAILEILAKTLHFAQRYLVVSWCFLRFERFVLLRHGKFLRHLKGVRVISTQVILVQLLTASDGFSGIFIVGTVSVVDGLDFDHFFL